MRNIAIDWFQKSICSRERANFPLRPSTYTLLAKHLLSHVSDQLEQLNLFICSVCLLHFSILFFILIHMSQQRERCKIFLSKLGVLLEEAARRNKKVFTFILFFWPLGVTKKKKGTRSSKNKCLFID